MYFFQVDFDVDIAALKVWYISVQYHFEPAYSEHERMDVTAAYPFPTTEGFIYFYGEPRKATNMLSLISNFPTVLWGLILLSTLCSYGFLVLAYSIYQNVQENDMVTATDEFSIFMKVLGSLTEPDSINIFHRWSAGRK